jgi:hypothetical protein
MAKGNGVKQNRCRGKKNYENAEKEIFKKALGRASVTEI